MPASEPEPDRRSNLVATRLALGILLLHGALLGYASYVTSPNLDEPAHLASGISHWTFGRFELYRVNPPLVRMVAAIPVLFTEAKTDWSGWNPDIPFSRSEFHAGTRFVILNGPTGFWYFTLARWACIPLCLVGAWVVFRWATELYGPRAGLVAITLYGFCPNMIAWGASITPDAVGASFGVWAGYTFWKWHRDPSWKTALQAGLALGLAELAKGTWVILFVLWPILWGGHRLASWGRQRNTDSPGDPAPPAAAGAGPPAFRQLLVIILLALYLLNLGFGFEGSFKPLRDYKFVSKSLSGETQPQGGANRFAKSWLGRLPVPLPENYVRGLDVQKYDFERGKWSYLCGEQRKGGWWYYYLVAFVVKSPVGTLVLLAVATAALLQRRYRAGWSNELLLLVPALAVLILVSSQTGFNRYLRYCLPAFPFLFIHASRVAVEFRSARLRPSFVAVACVAIAAESMSAFPHSMSFFNSAVGGPAKGHVYLLDANIDWGQDLLFLKRWYDQHPEARPFHLRYFGDMDISPEAAGITAAAVPGSLSPQDQPTPPVDLPGPQPGWFAVSCNHIWGYHHYEFDRPEFTYFQRLEPAGRAGYSISIFHLTFEQANALRAELGLPSLAPPASGP